jgi:hypothetical protein
MQKQESKCMSARRLEKLEIPASGAGAACLYGHLCGGKRTPSARALICSAVACKKALAGTSQRLGDERCGSVFETVSTARGRMQARFSCAAVTTLLAIPPGSTASARASGDA